MPTTPTAMDTVIAAIEETRRTLQHRTHKHCYACGAPEKGGLGLHFITQPDGSVTADWACPINYQSYDGILHGGIIATLLDGAMVHALFANGIVAQTAELCVRYKHPVKIGCPVRVTAHRKTLIGPLHQLTAQITQSEIICAVAQAKFMAAATLFPAKDE